jgi:hypothetical protein
MGYFQDVVSEYLRANRATFINTECCIQLNRGNPDTSGPHWFCDAVAINLEQGAVFLCEVTYAKKPAALLDRLRAWNAHWPRVLAALQRDCHLRAEWPVKPWVFLPQEVIRPFEKSIDAILAQPQAVPAMPRPDVTALEDVVPWKYPSWDRKITDVPPENAPHS